MITYASSQNVIQKKKQFNLVIFAFLLIQEALEFEYTLIVLVYTSVGKRSPNPRLSPTHPQKIKHASHKRTAQTMRPTMIDT